MSPHAQAPRPYPWLFSVAFYWRSSLPFASRETLQTLQKAPKPFWHPCPRTPRHQGHIRGFSWPSTPHQWLFTGVQACRLPAVKRSKRSKRLQNPFGTHVPARPGTKAISMAFLGLPPMAFYWRSSLPFASRETLQTLQKTPKPFWHPCPRTPRHQGHIRGFSWPSTPHQWLFTGVQACCLPAVKRSKHSKRLQNPFGTHVPARPGTKAISMAFLGLPRHINGFLLAFKPAVCQP